MNLGTTYGRQIRQTALLLSILGAAVTAPAVFAQTPAAPKPLMHLKFDKNEEGWMAEGKGAKSRVTPAVNVENASLAFDYRIIKGELYFLHLPIAEGSLAKAKTIRFRVKADTTTSLIFALQEKGGARYATSFYVPGGKWQTVEIAVSDFLLTEDTKDSNGKLDMDEVIDAAFIDMGVILSQVDNKPLLDMLGVQAGERTFSLADFTVTEQALPAPEPWSKEIPLDTFLRPQLTWLGFGNIQMSKSTGKPLSGTGMKVVTTHVPGRVIGIVKMLSIGVLKDAQTLSFEASAQKQARFVVQLEEKGGAKYNAMITIPADQTLQKFTLAFADFTLSEDSKDANDKLDLDQVKQILFFDLDSIVEGTEPQNTIWIGNLRAVKK